MVEAKERLVRSHRSQIDIIADVLRESTRGAKKTQIMYGCNLSFRQLRVYTSLLLERGLLRKVLEKEKGEDPKFFKATSKGKNLLRAYDSLIGLIGT